MRVVLFQADLVSGHADTDEVVGFEHVEGLLFGQCHVDPKSSLFAPRGIRLAEQIVYPICPPDWQIEWIERYELAEMAVGPEPLSAWSAGPGPEPRARRRATRSDKSRVRARRR